MIRAEVPLFPEYRLAAFGITGRSAELVMLPVVASNA